MARDHGIDLLMNFSSDADHNTLKCSSRWKWHTKNHLLTAKCLTKGCLYC